MIAGAIGALLPALTLDGAPSAIAIPAAALGGALFGMAWVLIPALLRAFLNVNEILSTLLFTVFAALLIEYLLNDPLKPASAITPQSEAFRGNATLGLVVEGTRFHAGVLVVVVVGIASSQEPWRVSWDGSRPRASSNGCMWRSPLTSDSSDWSSHFSGVLELAVCSSLPSSSEPFNPVAWPCNLRRASRLLCLTSFRRSSAWFLDSVRAADAASESSSCLQLRVGTARTGLRS